MLLLRRSRIDLVAIVLALAACRSTTSSLPSGPVRIDVSASRMRVHNTLSVPVFYFAYDRAAVATVEWIRCANPDSCPGVMPGATVTIPVTAIGGYRAGRTTEVVFYWWVAEPSPSNGQPTPGPVHTAVIKLR